MSHEGDSLDRRRCASPPTTGSPALPPDAPLRYRGEWHQITLNAKNLEGLCSERLAELLIEISTGNAAIKRWLRLELAGAQSPKEVAREVRKRLADASKNRCVIGVVIHALEAGSGADHGAAAGVL
jgi:hypothetical protein